MGKLLHAELLHAIKIRNETESSADIYIHGLILDDRYNGGFWEEEDKAGYVLPIDVRNNLQQLQGKDLTIYINSDGGYVSSGIAIANMIARHDGHTTAVIDGWAASIASVIFMACDTLKMPENTWLMIHKPSADINGNADDLAKGISVLDTMQKGIEATYATKTKEGVTEETIHEMVNAETWMTAKEAAEIFNIEVIGAQMEAAACAGTISNHFLKVPKGLLESPIFIKPQKDINKTNKEKQKAFILRALANSR
jgi:ATP-dependent protease ClpP protease subunit